MAHPSRRTWAEDLGRRLEAEVVYDADGVEWHTARRALLSYDPASDWHVVIQDDAIPCDQFRDALDAVLPHARGLPVGLYLGTVRPQGRLVTRAVASAQRAGVNWIEWQGGGPRWGVGVAYPTRQIPALVAGADLDPHPHYDARVRRFYKLSGVSARYPLPSLVDHRPADENPSLICSQNPDRRAHVFQRDVSDVDWSGGALVIDRRGRFTVPAAP